MDIFSVHLRPCGCSGVGLVFAHSVRYLFRILANPGYFVVVVDIVDVVVVDVVVVDIVDVVVGYRDHVEQTKKMMLDCSFAGHFRTDGDGPLAVGYCHVSLDVADVLKIILDHLFSPVLLLTDGFLPEAVPPALEPLLT